MDRRRWLGAVAGAVAATAGCLTSGLGLGDGPETPSVEGDEPTVQPGRRVVLTVRAAGVDALWFIPPTGAGVDGADSVAGLDVDPRPSHVAQRLPPVWHWDRPRSVTAELVVEVAADAPDGSFEYGVGAERGGERLEESFVVRVTGA